MTFRSAMAVAVLGCAVLSSGGRAQDATDPGDLAFWQSIQNSTNPAEFQAYLQAYPSGRFAGLARIRASGAGPVPAPTPAPADTAAAEEYKIGITPTAARVGTIFKIDCGNIPTGNSYDMFIVVPAGTPEAFPNGVAKEAILYQQYTNSCPSIYSGPGPFAPGAYELRWITTLFNNDRPSRYETKARVRFSVR